MAIEITKRPYEKVFSGNPVHYELHSTLAASDPDVSFEVKVRFKKIGPLYTYEDVVSLPYAPVNGYATVDLKEILDSILEFDLPQFAVDETTVWNTDKQTGKFYLQFREITPVNPDPNWDDSESAFESFVIKGGLSDFKYQGNNFWINFYDAVKPFLTWQPSGTRLLKNGKTEPVRLVAADERMYLAWLCSTGQAGSSIKARVFYTDGTTANKVVGIGVSTPLIGTIYYLPCGCDQLGLNDVTPSKTIWYWTIQVVDVNDNTEFSEIFKYELDNRHDEIAITLSYRNSLGGLDSQRVRGSVEKKLGYTYSELEKTIEPDYFSGHYFTPQKIISGNIEQLVYSGNLGTLRKEEQDRLRDAQMIRETWTVRSGKWVPLNIITKDFTLVKNDDKRWSMPIEFTLGYAGSEYYTPDNIDLGEGVFVTNVCRAFISPLAVSRDAVTGDDAWVMTAGENDPQNASDEYRFRVIKNSDGSVARDWEVVGWGLPIPFTLTNDTGFYTVEAQAICTNGVFGKKSSVVIDTTIGAPGGGSGGGTGTGTTNSYIDNQTSFSGEWDVDVDFAAQSDNGSVGAGNTAPFNITVDPGTDIHIRIQLPDFTPSSVIIESGGVNYYPTTGGIITWTFDHVNIVDGIRITLH
jgi:hypothetical protein